MTMARSLHVGRRLGESGEETTFRGIQNDDVPARGSDSTGSQLNPPMHRASQKICHEVLNTRAKSVVAVLRRCRGKNE